MAALIAEATVLMLAMALMAVVVFGSQRYTKLGASLMGLAMAAAALAVAHQWFH